MYMHINYIAVAEHDSKTDLQDLMFQWNQRQAMQSSDAISMNNSPKKKKKIPPK